MIGELAGLGSAMAWAVVSTIMRSLASRINPVMVNGLRCGFAALTMALLVVMVGHVGLLMATPLSRFLLIVVSGVIGQGLGDASLVTSMKSIGASRALPISSIQPLLTTTLAVLFVGEEVTATQVVGTLLVLLSVYMLAMPYGSLLQIRDLLAGADKRGVLLALLAACCWAVSSVILKEGLRGVDLLSANLIRMTTAFAVLTSGRTLTARGAAFIGIDQRAVATFVGAGLVGAFSALGYVTAVAYAGAAKASVLASTVPVFGLPISVFFLHERVNRRIAVGSLLCVFGIWLVLK